MSGDAAEEVAGRVLARLGEAWNAGDGTAFGEPFAAHGRLQAPTGPLAGEHASTLTLVLVRLEPEAEWQIAAFQNTLVAPPR